VKLKLDTPITKIAELLDARTPDLLDSASVPGASLAILREGACVWAGGFGLQNAKTKVPVTPETAFEAYSCTKPLVAYVALRMCEEDVLDLDSPLDEYLDEPYVKNDPQSGKITLRTALSHTAGLPDDDTHTLVCDPGEQWSYSTGGYYLVQEVIETVSSQSFEQVMFDQVLTPLRMESSAFTSDTRFNENLAQGHWKNGHPEAREILQADADSLFTTASDYAKFLALMMSGDRTASVMQKASVRVSEHLSWGLGLGIQHTAEGDCSWHFGGVLSAPFNNLAIGFTEHRIGIVIMTNGEHGGFVFQELVELAIGGGYPIFPWSGFLKTHF
jgi:CubicO group peptidase (beta-lactamase class C family)